MKFLGQIALICGFVACAMVLISLTGCGAAANDSEDNKIQRNRCALASISTADIMTAADLVYTKGAEGQSVRSCNSNIAVAAFLFFSSLTKTGHEISENDLAKDNRVLGVTSLFFDDKCKFIEPNLETIKQLQTCQRGPLWQN